MRFSHFARYAACRVCRICQLLDKGWRFKVTFEAGVEVGSQQRSTTAGAKPTGLRTFCCAVSCHGAAGADRRHERDTAGSLLELQQKEA